jgi:predicted nucleotidyltransferase
MGEKLWRDSVIVAFFPVLIYFFIMENLYTLEEIRGKVADTARQYGVEKAYLFGSYARGEASVESDIDICIEKGKIRTLLDLSGFCQDLEESLDSKVDVVTTTGLRGNFKDKIEKEMVLIYG